MDCKMSISPEIKEDDPNLAKKLSEKFPHLSFKWNIVKSVKTVKAVEDFIKDLDDLAALSCQAEDLTMLTITVAFRSLSYLYLDLFKIAAFEIQQWSLYQPKMFEAYFDNKGSMAELKKHFVMNENKENLIKEEREETDVGIHKLLRSKYSDLQTLFGNDAHGDENYLNSLKSLKTSLMPIWVAVMVLKLRVIGKDKLEDDETKNQLLDVLEVIHKKNPIVLELLSKQKPPENPFEMKITKEAIPFWIVSFVWPLFNDIKFKTAEGGFASGVIRGFFYCLKKYGENLGERLRMS